MGHETVLYGYIKGATRRPGPHFFDLHPLNRAVINRLPLTDDWPFLTRAMFSYPGNDADRGRYRRQLIHFGATLKQVEEDWEEWQAKFEALLCQLYWTQARVHLETDFGTWHVFTWKAINLTHYDPTKSPRPSVEWTFEEVQLPDAPD